MSQTNDLHGLVPDESSVVLLLVDVVNDLEFEGGDAILPHALGMATHIASLKSRARAANVACVYANDNWGRWRSNFNDIIEATRGTRGWEIARTLMPEKDDYFVLKAKHSAFYATPLDLLLRHLGAKTLIVMGLAAENCVLFSAGDAYMLEYRVIVPFDCIASETDELWQSAIEHMARVLKADVPTSTDLDFGTLGRE